jgi:hypothetical protein
MEWFTLIASGVLFIITWMFISDKSDADEVRSLKLKVRHLEQVEAAEKLIAEAITYGLTDYVYSEGYIVSTSKLWPGARSVQTLNEFSETLKEMKTAYLERQLAECCEKKRSKK